MKKLLALVWIAAAVGCSPEKKEVDYSELLKVRESIEKGSGSAIRRYEEMIENTQLANLKTDPQFIALKDQALADVNDLIARALENHVDKDAIVDCIRNNGADSPECEQYVQPLKTNASSRMKQFDADLGKFIANHMEENKHLPKHSGNCTAIRNGTFETTLEDDTLSISRTQDFQIEQFRGDTRKEKVTWINDCTYRLELIKEESDIRELEGPGNFLDDSFIEIIRVTDEYYMYKIFSSVDGQEGELVDIGKVFLKK